MAYNSKNRLLHYQKIQEEVQKHYVPGVTTYSGIFYAYIKKDYPMCYGTFMKIIGINVKKLLKEFED